MNSDIEELVFKAIEDGNLRQLKALSDEYGVEAIRLDTDPEEFTALHLATIAGQLEITESR